MSFLHLFKASVDTNSQLSNFETLNYLKACLNGDAAKLIASALITDANFRIAMRTLHDRYENKRCIVQAHLKAIRTQPSLRNESLVWKEINNLRKSARTHPSSLI